MVDRQNDNQSPHESDLARSWRETQERDAFETRQRRERAEQKEEENLARAQAPGLLNKLYNLGVSGLRRIPGLNR